MDEIKEKIYCSTPGNSNDALIASLLNQKSNGMWDNPFVYLVWMMFANRFFGNGENSNLENLRTQMSDNQNSSLLMDAIRGNANAINQLAQNLNCDFNTLNACCCDLRQGIAELSGKVGYSAEKVINAIAMGDANLARQLQECCCENRLAICNQTNTLLSAINNINTGLERGFANVAYETQKQTCDIINNANGNTQRIIDTLNNHWTAENQRQIQDLKFELSQERQNNYLAKLIAESKTATPTTA